MYDNVPPMQEMSDSFLDAIARKAFLRANLPSEEWPRWYEDARQVILLSLLESQGQPDKKRVTTAKWRAFDFVIEYIYGQNTDWIALEDRTIILLEDSYKVEWQYIIENFLDILPPEYATIAVLLLQGKSNYEIGDLLNYKNEDSARTMVSKVRRKILEFLED